MKRTTTLILSILLTGLFFVSCKKCTECTTTTSQNVGGYNQDVTVTQEYCGDNVPAEGTVTNGGQTVTITCK